jgi:large subunit ribosomal protein L22
MSYHAIHRHARIAPRKARLVADMIRGKRIDEAMTSLQFSKKRAAWYFKAVLKSAIANAEEQEADVHAAQGPRPGAPHPQAHQPPPRDR